MKHSTILALGFIAAALVPAALAQDKEAEKLFRDMEKKIKGAKALEIVFTYKLEGKTTAGDTGKGFHAMLAVVLSRGGIGYMVYGLPYWIHGDGGIDPDKPESRMTVYDFKAGAAEKVGERKAKVVRYRFGKGGK